MTIQPIDTLAALAAPSPAPSARAAGAGFRSLLNSTIGNVEAARQSADAQVAGFLNGGGELHTVVLAAQRAELAFELFVQVRNKVVSAYQELMRMQL